MKITPGKLAGLVIIEPRVFRDDRGFFLETYNERPYAEAGIPERFVQDNHSRSSKGILRGLHYQIKHPQGKLCRASRGEVLDVAVDLRRSSPTFGQWESVLLNDENQRLVYVPPGFAHGFCVLSEMADVEYKCSTHYDAEDEVSVLWNDPDLGIPWPNENPILSDKDANAEPLAKVRPLPLYEDLA